jgi:putative SOS response-associated peptidase YedK
MCGRYRIKDTDELTAHLRQTFGIPDWVVDRTRYNIAPSQELPVVARDDEGKLTLATMRWGFVPFWERSEKLKLAPINAQAEKVATNAMFQQAVQQRRCLVPADGFYEWLRVDEKAKVPFDIHLKSGRSFFMAGLFEKSTETRPATYAILTTRANELMARIHSRMPAILDDSEAKRWVEPGSMTSEQVAELTVPHPTEEMEAAPISSLVNSPRNDGPEVLEPVAFVPPPPKPAQSELF